MNTTTGPLIQGRFTRTVRVGACALAILAGPFGGGVAAAEQIHWGDVGPCYDRGVLEQKPIVLLLYDKVTKRFDADSVAMRLSLSPRIQAVASKATWCFGDVSSDIVSRNISNALQITYYPSVSVMAPNGKMLDETARVSDLSARIDGSGFEAAAEDYIVQRIERLAAKYRGKH